jgi:hypothetical protein
LSDEFYQMVKGVSDSAVKPLCKLIDAVSAGAGLLYEPIHIRRIAKAECDAIIVRAQAEIALSDLKQRAAARLTNMETQRQINIESIVEKAASNLPSDCSKTPVDQDWMAAFFDCCKDVGNAEVQELWGKLLSDEVSQPGTYSRRALDSLRLMSTSEAALFAVLGFRVWMLDDWPILFIPKSQGDTWPKECPFLWSHILSLSEIGLIESQICDQRRLSLEKNDTLTFEYYGHRVSGRTQAFGAQREPFWLSFSRLGKELVPLVIQAAGLNDDYFKECCKCLRKPDWTEDPSSEFRQFSISPEMLDSLNIGRALDK